MSACFVIALVALAVASHDEAAKHVDALSAVAAVCLLAIYASWLVPYLRSDTAVEEAHESPHSAVPFAVSVTLLAVAGVGAGVGEAHGKAVHLAFIKGRIVAIGDEILGEI